MTTMCPVCNGLLPLVACCPSCGGQMEDCGRFTDFLLDYSPYRPIDDLTMTDGIPDNARRHQCVHVMYCPACGIDRQTAVQEWPSDQPRSEKEMTR